MKTTKQTIVLSDAMLVFAGFSLPVLFLLFMSRNLGFWWLAIIIPIIIVIFPAIGFFIGNRKNGFIIKLKRSTGKNNAPPLFPTLATFAGLLVAATNDNFEFAMILVFLLAYIVLMAWIYKSLRYRWFAR